MSVFPADAPRSAALIARAPRPSTPGGVNSPVRAFRAVGGTPRFMARGHGPYLVDADGREYVDLVCSWGPMLLGHAHPEVVEAVQAAVARGTSFGTPTEGEVELAEEIVARGRPVEQVRLVSSGTEATMSAIRLARGFTGRDQGGEVRRLLPRPRRRAARRGRLRAWPPSGCPTPPASPARHAADTVVLPYNDLAAVDAAFAEHGDQIACVITEAAAGNMGVVPPRARLQRRPGRDCAGATARCSSATR